MKATRLPMGLAIYRLHNHMFLQYANNHKDRLNRSSVMKEVCSNEIFKISTF